MWKLLLLMGMALGLVTFKPATRHVILDKEMMDYLEQVAETTHVETARCINMYEVGDTVILNGAFEAPWLEEAKTDSSMNFYSDGCPIGTGAWWHAHPWRTVRRFAARWNRSPQSYCEMVGLDARPKEYAFSIISIRRGMSCLFYQRPDGTHAEIPLQRDST